MNQDEHPKGAFPSDTGKSDRELEGSIESFGTGDSLTKEFRGPTGGREAPMEYGDSRPDGATGNEGFIDVTDTPMQVTSRDEPSAPVLTEDPVFLEQHRVDLEDAIVAKLDLLTGDEIAVVQPRGGARSKSSANSPNQGS